MIFLKEANEPTLPEILSPSFGLGLVGLPDYLPSEVLSLFLVETVFKSI